MGDPTLKEQVHEQMTAALRAGDKLRLGALRMLAAAITNREKEILHELSDDEVREVAGKEIKKRSESIEAFGPNLMDPGRRQAAADHGRRQGRGCAAEVHAVWR